MPSLIQLITIFRRNPNKSLEGIETSIRSIGGAGGLDGVEILINPWKGLKHWIYTDLIQGQQAVEILINPWKGLKPAKKQRRKLLDRVEILINPWKGLKLALLSTSTIQIL